MTQFKQGDRVLYVGTTTRNYFHKAGTVRSASADGKSALVKFDNMDITRSVAIANLVRTGLPVKGPFDLGAKIALKGFTSRPYTARSGATAIVCGYNENGNVVVAWTKGDRAFDQADGDYPVSDFNIVTNTGGVVGHRPAGIIVDEVASLQPWQTDFFKFLTSPQLTRGRITFRAPPPQLPKDPPAAPKGTFIIVLVDANGDLKPSPTPKPHDYWVDAEAEAERLSKKYPGNTFMVLKGVGTVKTPAPKAVWA